MVYLATTMRIRHELFPTRLHHEKISPGVQARISRMTIPSPMRKKTLEILHFRIVFIECSGTIVAHIPYRCVCF